MPDPMTPRFENEDAFAKWWDEVQKDPTASLPRQFQSADSRLMLDIVEEATGSRLATCFWWRDLEGNERILLVRKAQDMGLLAPAE